MTRQNAIILLLALSATLTLYVVTAAKAQTGFTEVKRSREPEVLPPGVSTIVDGPELDPNKRLRLLEILGEMPVQTFISCIGPNDVTVPAAKNRRMFHVEHGRVTQSP